ncbi:MAG: hypothetical protein NC092_04530 [Butyrivibrio sp.]|nr:hypothetical protein [Muribaculum sp.]MCM1551940.1 hypothetical protein [Butyrivibrio sp.]
MGKSPNYEISHIGDACISDTHHIGVNHDGNCYSVIFGRYENGGFCSIPNWGVGCELASFDDVFWNMESLNKTLKKKSAAEAIANAIADYASYLEDEKAERQQGGQME